MSKTAQPPRINLANLPTPLQPLSRLSKKLSGPTIWVKRDDLTHTAVSGNKIRKLEYVVAEALQQRCDVIITCGGIQSNHCRATALICAQLGLKCHLILRGAQPDCLEGNTFLANLAGAKITYLEPAAYRKNLTQEFTRLQASYEEQGLRAYCIPTGASDEVGLWGYYSMAGELKKDIELNNLNVQLIGCATGSGGTHAGLALGMHHLKVNTQVRGYAVCDSAAYFKDKCEQDINAWYQRYLPNSLVDMPNLDVSDEFIGPGYGIAEPEIYQTIRDLAQLEGLILDPVYTAKAFYGLLEQIKRGDVSSDGDVIFVHTGGLFGLFAHRHKM